MKKTLAFILTLLLLLSLFSCSKPKEQEVSETPPEPRAEESEMKGTLKVLSERFCWNSPMSTVSFNHYSPVRANIANIMDYFRELYPEVEIEVEYLPTDGEEREFFIKQRRVAMMAGKEVPDVYLMPTSSLTEMRSEPMEPLFKDVAQTMRSGWFADISGLYNGDTDLHTEELNKAVMDAGTVGGARYVLPLGYEIPVYMTRSDLIDKAGIDRERLNAGVDSMIDVFLELNEQGDPSWAANAYLADGMALSLLPKAADYDAEEALIEGKQVEELLLDIAECSRIAGAEWQRKQDAGEKSVGRGLFIYSYINTKSKEDTTVFGFDENCPGVKQSLTNLIDVTAIGKAMGQEIEFIPVRASDGTLNAEITYWGAVSAGCGNKKLAYEFLRLFLTPEVQHETGFQGKEKFYSTEFFSMEDGIPGEMSLAGWPVRYKGFTEKRWGRVLEGFENINSRNEKRKRELMELTIDDSDLPILDVPIDSARFISSIDAEFYEYIRPIENYLEVENYTQADAVKAGNEFVRNLKYHLAEG